MCLVQLRRLAGRLAIDQPVRTTGVELHYPIPNDLQCHPADRGCLGPPRPVIDGGQGQKPARLRRILRASCNGAQSLCVKISPQRDRHGEPPSFATLNQIRALPGIPQRVTLSETWYNEASAETSLKAELLPPQHEPAHVDVRQQW